MFVALLLRLMELPILSSLSMYKVNRSKRKKFFSKLSDLLGVLCYAVYFTDQSVFGWITCSNSPLPYLRLIIFPGSHLRLDRRSNQGSFSKQVRAAEGILDNGDDRRSCWPRTPPTKCPQFIIVSKQKT